MKRIWTTPGLGVVQILLIHCRLISEFNQGRIQGAEKGIYIPKFAKIGLNN